MEYISMITETRLIKNRTGWYYSVYWDNRSYANLISGTYSSYNKAKNALDKFVKTGKIDLYPEGD